MIETVLLDYLETELDNVPVYMMRPQNPPATWVLLDKTGSSTTNHIRTATFAVQSYAPSLYDAADLNETVKELIENMPATEDVSRTEITTDYNSTNPTTKEYRYTAVANITY